MFEGHVSVVQRRRRIRRRVRRFVHQHELLGLVSPRVFMCSRITSELTRRRKSKHPSPHQASYETRSRRSRPTIYFGATTDSTAQRKGSSQGRKRTNVF